MRAGTICLLWLGCFSAVAQVPETETPDQVDVIVRFKASPDDVGRHRFASHGAIHKSSLSLVRAHVYSVNARDLSLLSSDPEVAYIGLDHKLQATATTLAPDYGWMGVLGATSISATLPWDGSGIGVAVIDSGIDASADLQNSSGKNRVVYSRSFVPKDTGTSDAYGHGTMVAGLVGGNGAQSNTKTASYLIRGIAPNVNIVNLRVLDQNGSATDSTVISAIQQAIALKSQYNIRVINLSLGRPVYESYTQDPLCQAVEQAWQAGIVVVVAAGNDGRDNSQGTQGYATINVPGNDPYVITVGAMNTVGTLSRADDKMTSYSSKGPTLLDHVVKPDLVAPGNLVSSLEASKSNLVKTYSNNRVPWSMYDPAKTASPSPAYFYLSGTSLAAPMVSGAAALLLQQNPALTPDQVKARLMKTAAKLPAITTTAIDPVTGTQYTSENDAFTVGAGYLDAAAALNNTDLATAPAISPSASFNSATGTVTLITGAGAVWGTNAVWGTGAVWGTNAVWGTTVWGSGPVWGSNVAWGTSVAWGTTTVWGANAVWGTGSAVQSTAVTIAINGEY